MSTVRHALCESWIPVHSPRVHPARGQFMKLPSGERADLGAEIEDYVAESEHWEGDKACVFESMVGISLANREVLREAILFAAAHSDEVETLGIMAMERCMAALPIGNHERSCSGPYCLVLLESCAVRPIQVVVADNAQDKDTIVVTVYEPDRDEWEPDLNREKTHEVCSL